MSKFRGTLRVELDGPVSTVLRELIREAGGMVTLSLLSDHLKLRKVIPDLTERLELTNIPISQPQQTSRYLSLPLSSYGICRAEPEQKNPIEVLSSLVEIRTVRWNDLHPTILEFCGLSTRLLIGELVAWLTFESWHT